MIHSRSEFGREARLAGRLAAEQAHVEGVPPSNRGQALPECVARASSPWNSWPRWPCHRDGRDTNWAGGTVINIIFALIFFGLLAFGILWLIKSFGEAGRQYSDAMVGAQLKATAVTCQTNLRAIGQNIQLYAVSNEEFPPSQQALMEYSGSTQLFRCPAPDGEKYVYIPGQNPGMSPLNVLVYEPKPVHDGRCSVLRLGGQLELLTPEELQQALAQTHGNIR